MDTVVAAPVAIPARVIKRKGGAARKPKPVDGACHPISQTLSWHCPEAPCTQGNHGETAIPARVIKRKRGSAKKAFEAILAGRSVSNRAELCIPKLSFRRLVQEIAQGFKSDLRFQQDGIDALQEAVEMLVIERFKKCARLAELCRKDTVRDEHWNFVCNDEGVGPTLLG
jgi:histone H3/H4